MSTEQPGSPNIRNTLPGTTASTGAGEHPSGGEKAPSVTELNAWFEVLHRLAQLQRNDPLAPAFAPRPLREDLQACVRYGWVRAWSGAGIADDKLRLVLTPEGREQYAQWCQLLAEAGRPVLGQGPAELNED